MKRDRLSKIKDCGLAVSYTLTPKRLVIHLLGIIPLHTVRLDDVAYLRLATRDEVPAMFYLRNMRHFRPSGAAHCPVYVLKTRKRGTRVFLKLRGGAHFRLRSAIGHQRRREAYRDAAAQPTEPPKEISTATRTVPPRTTPPHHQGSQT